MLRSVDARAGLRAVLAAALILALALPAAALADHGDYATWGDAADRIDQYLDAAFELYLQDDRSQAYSQVNSAYFRVYETTGFERQTMTYVSGPRKNAVEMQFSACKGAVKNTDLSEEGKTEVRTALYKLKSMIREDGNKLAAKDGEAATETKYYDGAGNLLEQDPYPQYSADPDAAKKYRTWTEAAEAIRELLSTAEESYVTLQEDKGKDNIDNAYYGVYEESGLDREIYRELSVEDREAVDAAFRDLWALSEKAKGAAKENSYQGWSKKAFEKAIKAAKTVLGEKANTLDVKQGNLERAAAEDAARAAEAAEQTDGSAGTAAWMTFLGSFGLLLREGLEAILVIAAIIAYLVKSGNRGSLKNVYIGAIAGIAASIVAAIMLAWLKSAVSQELGGGSQEIIEGVTALIAVCVLFYVSNWMISKSEAASWSRYIDSRVQSSVEKGNSFALAFTAFLSVFREGAEVILFTQDDLNGDYVHMVWWGLAAAAVVLVFVYLAITKLSIKLPIKVFFTATSILMAVMCVAFLGSGIKELAEGGVFDTTRYVQGVPENEVAQVLGIYPYMETLLPQLILAIILLITFMIAHYRGKMDALRAEYEGKKA